MKRNLKLLLLLAMLMPAWLGSLHAETLTVCNDAGTACNQAPVYGTGFDVAGTESQMIYPASMLAGIPVGSTITAITFYPCTSGTLDDDYAPDFGSAVVELRLGETSASTIAGLDAMRGNRQSMTHVAYNSTIAHESASKSMTITFASGYAYNGGNLMIDFYLSQAGDMHSTYWHAKPVTGGAAYYSSGSNSGPALGINGRVVLPKMTITYTAPEHSAVATPASESTIDFGRVYVGTSATQTVTITNEGTASINPTVLPFNNVPFSHDYTKHDIATGQSADIAVTFTPNEMGQFTTTMTVNAYEGKRFKYTLVGEGTDDAALSVSFNPQVLDFGAVNAGQPRTKQLTITNHGTTDITAAALHIDGNNPPFTVPATVTIAAGGSITIDVTFDPTDATSHNQRLWFETNGCTYETSLRGIGLKEGAKAIRDRAFFAGKSYTWKVNNEGAEQTSTLTDVATDPDQMIALFRKVYMDQEIPGNWYRGYKQDGSPEWDASNPNKVDGVVDYAGVGRMTSATAFDDCYGWGIPGNIVQLGQTNHRLDPNQYKPMYDGVTLLLVEINDGVQLTADEVGHEPSNYSELRDYCARWFKSVRVVTESMLVGEEGSLNEATLFKVDCNQMNRFFLAKGRLRTFVSGSSTLIEGAFWSSRSNSYVDVLNYGPFYHMFEQLSAYDLIGEQNATDIYQSLLAMET